LRIIHRKNRAGRLHRLPAHDIEYAKALYDGGIRYVDEWIGSFLSLLDTLGLMDRATVILLSDHGEEFQEHGWVLHSQLYSTVTRIPLIIRPPGGVSPRTVSQVVESIDVMPTVLEMVGAEMPSTPIHGHSLVPLIHDQMTAPREAFGEFPRHGGDWFIADGSYQLVLGGDPETAELFDFRADPLEQVELSAGQPEIAATMIDRLAEWRRRMASEKGFHGDPTDVDPEVEEQLRALGYLDER
jgi:arylsulfatase A-like enzyme